VGAFLEGDGEGTGVPHAATLIEFGEAMLGGDQDRQSLARQSIYRVLGPEGLVDAAAIVASFNAVVKIADATGIPLEDFKEAATQDLREALGLERFNNNTGPA
jgi:hypothetical protein